MSDWWQPITHTIAAEFSDVPDAAQVTRIVVRLGVASLLGGLLGWEREHACVHPRHGSIRAASKWPRQVDRLASHNGFVCGHENRAVIT